MLTYQTGYVYGDGVGGSPVYSGTGQVGVISSTTRMPPIKALTRDGLNNLYWTDSLGAVRRLNPNTSTISNYCAPTDANSCTRLNTTGPSVSRWVNCSQLCSATTTGLTVDPSTGFLYLAYDDSLSAGSVILRVLPSGNATWWCGAGLTGMGNGITTVCQTFPMYAPTQLLVYNGVLMYLEAARVFIAYIALTPNAQSQNLAGILVGCYLHSSSCVGAGSQNVMVRPTAMTIDSSGNLYVADSNNVFFVKIGGAAGAPNVGQLKAPLLLTSSL